MLLAWRFPQARAVGIEAQAVSVDLAQRSLAWNGAADRCAVVHGDLRDPAVLRPGAAFDLMTGTPPYLRPGTATPSARMQRGPAHLELRGGIEAYCLAAARWLAPGGRFVACAAAAQLRRVSEAATGWIRRSWYATPRASGRPPSAPSASAWGCRREARLSGGCPSNHGGCGERSGGCERRARSSLLRRAFRHASSVVAALAALAPRLVRLARHDYSDRLLGKSSSIGIDQPGRAGSASARSPRR